MGLRQAVLYELAVQSNIRPDDIRLSQIADGDVLDAARTVRRLVAAADASAECLAATAFLDTPDD